VVKKSVVIKPFGEIVRLVKQKKKENNKTTKQQNNKTTKQQNNKC